MKISPKFMFDGEKLAENRALRGDTCYALFLSPNAYYAIAVMSEMLLWATRWTDDELPEEAGILYKELNQMPCDIQVLGQTIGEAVSNSVTVNCSGGGGCSCGGGGAGTIYPDGTVAVPPLSTPEDYPPEWVDDTTGVVWGVDVDPEKCEMAYQIWAFYRMCFSLMAVAGGQLLVLAVVVAALLALWPAAFAAAVGTGAAAYVALLVVSNIDTFNVILEQLDGLLAWIDENKDGHICAIALQLDTSVGGAMGYYQTAIIARLEAVIAAPDWAGVLDWLEQFFVILEPMRWAYSFMYEGVAFEVEDMPVDYVCCPVDDNVYSHVFGSTADGEPVERSSGLSYSDYGWTSVLLMNNAETGWVGMRTGSLNPTLPPNQVYVEVAFRVSWEPTSGSLTGYVQLDVETGAGTLTSVPAQIENIPNASTWLTVPIDLETVLYWASVGTADVTLTAVTVGAGAGKLRVMEMRLTTRDGV